MRVSVRNCRHFAWGRWDSDSDSTSRFKKLFGLAKEHVHGIPHLWQLIKDEEYDRSSSLVGEPTIAVAAGGKQMSDKVQRKLKRVKIDSIDGVIHRLLGKHFKGGMGQFGGPYNDLMVVLPAAEMRENIPRVFVLKCGTIFPVFS